MVPGINISPQQFKQPDFFNVLKISIELYVDTILAMARHLGLKTIAEGVETKEQLDFLMTQGCNRYQGY